MHASLFSADQSDLSNMCAERFRIFRAEKTYCVNAGKWYFELEVSRDMIMHMIMCLVNTKLKAYCDYLF